VGRGNVGEEERRKEDEEREMYMRALCVGGVRALFSPTLKKRLAGEGEVELI
jgi:hypothetical protein